MVSGACIRKATCPSWCSCSPGGGSGAGRTRPDGEPRCARHGARSGSTTLTADTSGRRPPPRPGRDGRPEAFAAAAAEGQPLHRILRYTQAPIVSRDIVGDPASRVFDAALTQASGRPVKAFGWYDNKWGYTNRLIDLTTMIAARETA